MIKSLWRSFSTTFLAGVDTRFIVSESAGMYAVRIAYKGLNFLSALILARALSAEQFGAFNLAFSWASLLTTLALLGMDPLTVREITKLEVQQEWDALKGYLKWVFRQLLLNALAVAVLFALISSKIYTQQPVLRFTFLISATLIPLFGLVRLLQPALEGLKLIAIGRLPDMVLQPLSFIVGIWLLKYFFPTVFSSALAVALYAFTTLLLSIGIGFYLLKRKSPEQGTAVFSRRMLRSGAEAH